MVATEIQTIRKILEASDRDFATAKDSLNTAWRRANSKGEDLGQFGIDAQLTTKQINFVLDWLNGTKSTAVKPQPQPQMQVHTPPQYPDLRTDLAAAKERIANLENRLREAVKWNDERLETIEQLKEELESAPDAEELREQIKRSESEIDDLKALLKDADSRVRARFDTIEELKNKLTEANLSLNEHIKLLQNKEASISEAKNTIQAYELQIKELQTAVEKHNQKWFVKFKKATANLTILEVINYADIIVMQVGLVTMFPTVGWVFGLPACLFYFDSILTVKRSSSYESSQFALAVTIFLNIIFAFVHYNTAIRNIEGDTFSPFWVALTAAIVQSGINFSALRQAYLKKIEN